MFGSSQIGVKIINPPPAPARRGLSFLMKTQSFMYYDTVAAEWKPATLEELAMLDDPSLAVCPLNPDGSPGQQTTYAQIERASRPAPVATKTPAQQPVPAKNAPTEKGSPANNDMLLRYTLRYIAGVLTFFVFAICIIGGLATGSTNGFFIGLLIGAIISCVLHYRAKSAAKSDKI